MSRREQRLVEQQRQLHRAHVRRRVGGDAMLPLRRPLDRAQAAEVVLAQADVARQLAPLRRPRAVVLAALLARLRIVEVAQLLLGQRAHDAALRLANEMEAALAAGKDLEAHGERIILGAMTARHGGSDRVSTKAKLAAELRILGEVLARVRERAGVKQADLAARLGMPASYLSKIESGTRRLDVIELVQIAEALGTDPAEIVRQVTDALRNRP